MESSNKIPKKIIKIMVQLGDFVGFDVWQRGFKLSFSSYTHS